jgi:hypothetical protein
MITKIVSLLLVAAAIAGLVYNGISTILDPDALEAARRENEALKARREALREEAFALGARANDLLERGRQLDPASEGSRRRRSASLPPPAPNASNEAIVAWISLETAKLEALAVDVAPGDERPALLPDTRPVQQPALDRNVLQVRELERPSDMNTNMAERQRRQTGDSS